MIFKSCLRILSLVSVLFLVSESNLSSSVFAQSSSSSGREIFANNCAVCHSLGSDDKVGPGMAGVTNRRDEAWLKSFIQHPSKMFDIKDPTAVKLLDKYKIPMPEKVLTDSEVDEIIKYLNSLSAAATPVETPKIIKKVATAENISKGMALFQGTKRFYNQGPACISCHDVRKKSFFAGGGLAKDLTTSYSRLGEEGLNSMIKNPPFPVMREAYKNHELTNEEINYLNDFLGNTDEGQKPTEYQSDMLTLSILFLVGLFLFFYFIIWAVGK